MTKAKKLIKEQNQGADIRVLYTLPAEMTIENAEQLAAELKQLPLAENAVLTLDASKVENITTPGLQLIVSLEKSLAAESGVLAITGKTDVFAGAFKEAGLGSLLGKD